MSTSQYVIVVAGHDQTIQRQAHLRGYISRKDVAEVASRHTKRNWFVGTHELGSSSEVIDGLCGYARPIDAVDCTQSITISKCGVSEHCLN